MKKSTLALVLVLLCAMIGLAALTWGVHVAKRKAPQESEVVSAAPAPEPLPPANETPEKRAMSDAEKLQLIKDLTGRRDVSALLIYLESTHSPLIQDAALEALTGLGAVEAIEAMAKLIETPDDMVQTQLMKSLATLGAMSSQESDKLRSIEVLEQLYRRFEEAGNEVQTSNAIEALALIPHERSLDFLMNEIKARSGDPFLQYFIVEALGKMGDPRALVVLDKLAESLPRNAQPRSEEELGYEALGTAIERAKGELVH